MSWVGPRDKREALPANGRLPRPEDQILYLCARQELAHAQVRRIVELCRDFDLDWDYVRFVAFDHSVAPAVYTHLSPLQDELALPERVLLPLKAAFVHNVVRKKSSRLALSAVLSKLAQSSLDVMLAKGVAYNLTVYRHDWLTERADVDLLVRRRREELSPDLLRSLDQLVEGLNGKMTAYNETVELDFYEHHDVSMNGVVGVDYERVWRDAAWHSSNGWPVLLMAPEDMLIIAAINACRKRFLRLRSLMDIAAVVAAYPSLKWSVLLDKAAQYRAPSFVYTALRVSQETVGCSLPAGVLDCLPVPQIHRKAIEAVLSFLLHRFDLRGLNRRTSWTVLGRSLSPSMLLKSVSFGPRHLVPWVSHVLHNRDRFEPVTAETSPDVFGGASAAKRGTKDGSDGAQSERPTRRP